MELTLPNYDFFTNGMAVEHEEPKKQRAGNAYTGSLGTDPQRGFTGSKAFEYRVLLKKDIEGNKAFIVSCCVRPPLSPVTEQQQQAVYPAAAESLPEIEKWLLEKYAELKA